MTIDKMRNETFSINTIEDWELAATKTLNKDDLRNLTRKNIEGIEMKPLYTSEDEELIADTPSTNDARRGFQSSLLKQGDWKIAQRMTLQPGKAIEQFTNALRNGQECISFEVTDNGSRLLQELVGEHVKYPLSLNAKEYQYDMIHTLMTHPNYNDFEGYLASDPLALMIQNGCDEDDISLLYDRYADLIKKTASNIPKIRTVLVDTTPYHNGGAHSVQEIAIALSTAVTHMEELISRGHSVEEIQSKILFQWCIGSQFFNEVAKLRAARICWGTILEAYGIEESNREMLNTASTSSYTKTSFDPYMNVLRATNEAFAAVLGGIDYLHVSPFDEPAEVSSEASERLARNTQLILKEEALLTKTIDPVGGSWFIEKLSSQLAEESWKLFLKIEEKGGFLETIKEGWIQEEIRKTDAIRNNEVETKKRIIVGMNHYVDLNDHGLKIPSKRVKKKNVCIQPIPQNRLSERWEELRRKSSAMKQQPKIACLILQDDLKVAAGIDAVESFFASGGMMCDKTIAVHDIEMAKDFINETPCYHYCMITNNGDNDLFLQVVDYIQRKYPTRIICAAAQSTLRRELEGKGIKYFIDSNSNGYDLLSSLLEEMEASDHE